MRGGASSSARRRRRQQHHPQQQQHDHDHAENDHDHDHPLCLAAADGAERNDDDDEDEGKAAEAAEAAAATTTTATRTTKTTTTCAETASLTPATGPPADEAARSANFLLLHTLMRGPFAAAAAPLADAMHAADALPRRKNRWPTTTGPRPETHTYASLAATLPNACIAQRTLVETLAGIAEALLEDGSGGGGGGGGGGGAAGAPGGAGGVDMGSGDSGGGGGGTVGASSGAASVDMGSGGGGRGGGGGRAGDSCSGILAAGHETTRSAQGRTRVLDNGTTTHDHGMDVENDDDDDDDIDDDIDANDMLIDGRNSTHSNTRATLHGRSPTQREEHLQHLQHHNQQQQQQQQQLRRRSTLPNNHHHHHHPSSPPVLTSAVRGERRVNVPGAFAGSKAAVSKYDGLQTTAHPAPASAALLARAAEIVQARFPLASAMQRQGLPAPSNHLYHGQQSNPRRRHGRSAARRMLGAPISTMAALADRIERPPVGPSTTPAAGAALLLRADPGLLASRFERVKRLRGHHLPVYCVCIDRRARWAVTGADDHLVKVWDLRTGFLDRTLRGHDGDIVDVATAPAHDLLVTAANDSTVRIWNIATGEPVAVLDAKWTREVNAIALAPCPDRPFLVTGGANGAVRLWRIDAIHAGPVVVSIPAVAPASRRSSATTGDAAPGGAAMARARAAHATLAPTRAATRNRNQPRNTTESAHSGPAGLNMAPQNGPGLQPPVTPTTPPLSASHQGHLPPSPAPVSVAATGVIAPASMTGPILEQSSQPGEPLQFLPVYNPVTSSVAGSIVQTELPQPPASVTGVANSMVSGSPSVEILSVTFNAGGTRFAVSGTDCAAHVYAVEPADSEQNIAAARAAGSKENTSPLLGPLPHVRLLTSLRGHVDYVYLVAFARNSDMVATGSRDGSARIWRRSRARIPSKRGRVAHLSGLGTWSSLVLDTRRAPSGRSSLTAFADGRGANCALTFRTDSVGALGNPVGPTDGSANTARARRPPWPGSVDALVWSLDDARIVTSSSDTMLRVWSVDTGDLLHVLEGHSNQVYVLEVHPFDKRILMSAGYDGVCNLWNIEKGVAIKRFHPLESCLPQTRTQGLSQSPRASESTLQPQRDELPHGQLPNGISQGSNPTASGGPLILDGQFAPNGMTFVVSDTSGAMIVFSVDPGCFVAHAPEEQFFSHDYVPIVRDADGHAVEEATRTPLHLLPRAILCNAEIHAHPLDLQRFAAVPENRQDVSARPHVVAPVVRTSVGQEAASLLESFVTAAPRDELVWRADAFRRREQNEERLLIRRARKVLRAAAKEKLRAELEDDIVPSAREQERDFLVFDSDSKVDDSDAEFDAHKDFDVGSNDSTSSSDSCYSDFSDSGSDLASRTPQHRRKVRGTLKRVDCMRSSSSDRSFLSTSSSSASDFEDRDQAKVELLSNAIAGKEQGFGMRANLNHRRRLRSRRPLVQGNNRGSSLVKEADVTSIEVEDASLNSKPRSVADVTQSLGNECDGRQTGSNLRSVSAQQSPAGDTASFVHSTFASTTALETKNSVVEDNETACNVVMKASMPNVADRIGICDEETTNIRSSLGKGDCSIRAGSVRHPSKRRRRARITEDDDACEDEVDTSHLAVDVDEFSQRELLLLDEKDSRKSIRRRRRDTVTVDRAEHDESRHRRRRRRQRSRRRRHTSHSPISPTIGVVHHLESEDEDDEGLSRKRRRRALGNSRMLSSADCGLSKRSRLEGDIGSNLAPVCASVSALPVSQSPNPMTTGVSGPCKKGSFPLSASDWLRAISSNYTYVPQVNDEVTYFPQGHRKAIQFSKKAGIDPLLVPTGPGATERPVLNGSSSGTVDRPVLYRVVGIEYRFPARLACDMRGQKSAKSSKSKAKQAEKDATFRSAMRVAAVLQLRRAVENENFIGDQTPSSDDVSLTYYPVDDLPEYLVLTSRVRAASQHIWKAGDRFRILFLNELNGWEYYTGFVRRVKGRAQSIPWNAIEVEYDNEAEQMSCPGNKVGTAAADLKNIDHVSPWELEPVGSNQDAGDLSFPPPPRPFPSSVDPALLNAIARNIGKLQNSEPGFKASLSWFIDPVASLANIPKYCDVVPCPLDLGVVMSRLRAGFYRCFDAFVQDMALIRSNALLFNSADSEIAQAASTVYARIIDAAERTRMAFNAPQLSASATGSAHGLGGGTIGHFASGSAVASPLSTTAPFFSSAPGMQFKPNLASRFFTPSGVGSSSCRGDTAATGLGFAHAGYSGSVQAVASSTADRFVIAHSSTGIHGTLSTGSVTPGGPRDSFGRLQDLYLNPSQGSRGTSRTDDIGPAKLMTIPSQSLQQWPHLQYPEAGDRFVDQRGAAYSSTVVPLSHGGVFVSGPAPLGSGIPARPVTRNASQRLRNILPAGQAKIADANGRAPSGSESVRVRTNSTPFVHCPPSMLPTSSQQHGPVSCGMPAMQQGMRRAQSRASSRAVRPDLQALIPGLQAGMNGSPYIRTGGNDAMSNLGGGVGGGFLCPSTPLDDNTLQTCGGAGGPGGRGPIAIGESGTQSCAGSTEGPIGFPARASTSESRLVTGDVCTGRSSSPQSRTTAVLPPMRYGLQENHVLEGGEIGVSVQDVLTGPPREHSSISVVAADSTMSYLGVEDRANTNEEAESRVFGR